MDGLDIGRGGVQRWATVRMPAVEGLHLNVACGYATFLAQLESGVPLAARQGTLMATTFHPELASDDRLHCYFIDLCSEVGTGAV